MHCKLHIIVWSVMLDHSQTIMKLNLYQFLIDYQKCMWFVIDFVALLTSFGFKEDSLVV